MKLKSFKKTALLLSILSASMTAQAQLFDRGGGMIYDSEQDITWLQDTNYSMTSGYDADGMMNWFNANTWADTLNVGGYDDWRLPGVEDIGNDGCNAGFSGTDCGYNVNMAGSEMAFMWYGTLKNIALYDTSGVSPQAGWGLSSTSADGVDFYNLASINGKSFWLNANYELTRLDAWYFDTTDGLQNLDSSLIEKFAWAVRDGDVVEPPLTAPPAVPVPAAVWLFGSGLLGLIGVARRGQLKLSV